MILRNLGHCYLAHKASPRRGFALVISLAVLAFVLLLVLTVAVLVRVETSSVGTSLAQLTARQNALLALNIALGELQQHAGPDQRVTARATLGVELEQNDNRRHWLGVWNTNAMEDEPVWLVSGSAGAEEGLPSINPQNAILILGEDRFGPDAEDSYVFAPKVRVREDTARVDHMAYWIDDEGMKASLAPIFDSDKITNNTSMSEEEHRWLLRQRAALSAGQPFFVSDEAWAASDQLGFTLGRISDLPLVWGESNEEQSEIADLINENAHHFTGRVYGLLTNTIDGGFRLDLSSLDRLSPELAELEDAWINEAVRESLNLWSEVEEGALSPRMVGGMNTPNDPSLKLTPFISELFIGLALSGNAANPNADEIFIYYLIFAELWNPFTVPLEFSPRDIYDDMIVRVSGLPTVDLTNTTRGENRTVELPELWMDLDFYDFIDGSQQDQFEPGRMTWTGNPAGSGGGSVEVEGVDHLRRNGVYIVSEPVGRIQGTALEDFRGEFSSADIQVEFFLKGDGFEDSASPHVLFWTLNLEGFEPFEREYIGGSPDPDRPAPAYVGSPSQFFRPRSTASHGVNRASINQARNSFNYWFRIDEELFLPGSDDFENIMENNVFQRNTTTVDMAGDFTGLNRLYEVSDIPEEMLRATTFSDLDFFSGKDSPKDTNPERWAYLIDIPRHQPTELAQLNFLVFSEENFEKLGHPNLSDLNRLYDRYFLSGLPSEINSAPRVGELAPNPRYRFMRTESLEDFENLASDFLVVGAFNVNSTSPLAWAEIFAGSDIPSWPVGTTSQAPTEPLRRAWFSLPDYGSRMFNTVFSGTDNYLRPLRKAESGFRDFANFALPNIPQDTPVPPAFRQGLRELTDEERLELGEQVSQRILDRGRPFASLREFWDSGIIQEAIESVPDLNADEVGNSIPYLSPGYFSQIQVASGAGSRFSARSDTFRIISYGEVENPLTGQVVSARCEVLVQRMPRRDLIDENAPSGGREFVVLEIKWLD